MTDSNAKIAFSSQILPASEQNLSLPAYTLKADHQIIRIPIMRSAPETAIFSYSYLTADSDLTELENLTAQELADRATFTHDSAIQTQIALLEMILPLSAFESFERSLDHHHSSKKRLLARAKRQKIATIKPSHNKEQIIKLIRINEQLKSATPENRSPRNEASDLSPKDASARPATAQFLSLSLTQQNRTSKPNLLKICAELKIEAQKTLKKASLLKLIRASLESQPESQPEISLPLI